MQDAAATLQLTGGDRASIMTKSAMAKLKRLVHNQLGFPQVEWVYSRQGVPKYWADEERKRWTTEVTEIFGGHPLDAALATQSLVGLSCAEEEFYACNHRTAGELQTCHFLTEAGFEVIPRVWSDSSACRGIVRRQGTSKLRHLEIRHVLKQ